MKKTALQPVKGARDFVPSEFAKRKWLFTQMITAAESFGFTQYDSPVLESIETFRTKTSSELVDEQSYRFTDRGGREITLRPEMTPVLARMIAGNESDLAFPVKWFSIPVLWRYEKPQSGRLREHFQWNVDIIGSSGALADAEVIALMCSFLSKVGLGPDKIKVHINDRNLLNQIFATLKIEDHAGQLSKIIDRINKISEHDFIAQIEAETKIKGLGLKLITLLNNPHTLELNENILQVIKYLKDLGYKDYIQLDPKIVRGLDYYTSTIFEVFPADFNSRAIAGGGRYDNLVGQFSSRNLPGVGFGMGDVVISNLLEKYHLYPDSLSDKKTLLVCALSKEAITKSIEISNSVRKSLPNLTVNLYPAVSQLRDVLAYGNTNNYDSLLIIGDKELAEEKYTLRDLNAGHQTTGKKAEIIKLIKGLNKK